LLNRERSQRTTPELNGSSTRRARKRACKGWKKKTKKKKEKKRKEKKNKTESHSCTTRPKQKPDLEFDELTSIRGHLGWFAPLMHV